MQSLRLRYRRTVLGYLWGLLHPMLNIVILAAVFSQLMRFSNISNYILYLVSGLVPWTFTVNSLLLSGDSYIVNEGFIKKIYLPKLIFPIVGIAGTLYDFLFALISLFLLVSILHFSPSPALLALPGAIALLIVFVFGFGTTIAVINVFFRDTNHLISVLLQVVFYMTPIIYRVEIVPERWRFLLEINPIRHLIRLFQVILYEGELPSLREWSVAGGLAFGALIVGWLVFKRWEKKIVFRL
jgi:ABC-type polysaccharide/polyol phosphate export permease